MRVGSPSVRVGGVHVASAELVRPVDVHVCGRQGCRWRHLTLDTTRHLQDPRQPEVPRHLVTTRWQDPGGAASPRIGIPGRLDDDVQLSPTVDLKQLRKHLRVEPGTEESGAPANGGATIRERRPGDAGAWRHGERVGHVSLPFMSEAEGDRQTLSRAQVVLQVVADPGHRERRPRIAEALRKGGRRGGGQGREAGERPRACLVSTCVRAVPATLEQGPGAQDVPPAQRHVHVRRQLHLTRDTPAGPLRSTSGERLRHDERGGLGHRRFRPFPRSDLQAELTVGPAANGTLFREPHAIGHIRPGECALGEVEFAHAETVAADPGVLHLDPDGVGRRERVRQTAGEAELGGRTRHRAGEEAGRQRGADRLHVGRRSAVDRERDGRAVADDGAVERETDAQAPFNRRGRCVGVTRAERPTATAGLERPLPLAEPGSGDDVDGHDAGLVALGCKQVSPKPDALDAMLWRHSSAAKPVHANDGAWPGHESHRLLECLGIVWKRGNLIRIQHRREPVAARVGASLAAVPSNIDFFDHAGDGQGDATATLPGADVHAGERPRLESRCLDEHPVLPPLETTQQEIARLVGDPVALGWSSLVRAADGHTGAHDDTAARIHDGDPERAVGRLRRQQRSAGEPAPQQADHALPAMGRKAHHGRGSNASASRDGLIRKVSMSHSSVVSAPTDTVT